MSTSTKLPFAESYTGRLRARIGKDLLFMPSVGAVIENSRSEILLVRRADDGHWALPGGLPELGDSISTCVKREVFEETGLTLLSFRAFAFSSRAEVEVHTYPNGDLQHAYRMLFYSNDFRGEARINDDESLDVRFFALGRMPPAKDFLRADWHALKLFVDFKKTDRFVCD